MVYVHHVSFICFCVSPEFILYMFFIKFSYWCSIYKHHTFNKQPNFLILYFLQHQLNKKVNLIFTLLVKFFGRFFLYNPISHFEELQNSWGDRKTTQEENHSQPLAKILKNFSCTFIVESLCWTATEYQWFLNKDICSILSKCSSPNFASNDDFRGN